MTSRKQQSNLKTRLLSRGLALARTGLKMGSMAAQHALKTSLNENWQSGEGYRKFLVDQVQALTSELGQLKGSVMKVGQLISTYGEHFLPPEANEVLKNLQFRSPTLAWPAIQAQLRRELTEAQLAALEIDETPFAAASIGQVHLATVRATGERLALKVQYPGVDTAIDTDLKFLKAVLAMGPLLPKGPRFDQIFSEVRDMLHQEVNYEIERAWTERFREWLTGDEVLYVPKVYPEFSARRVLATEFIPGVTIDSEDVQKLSLARRNRLGAAYLRHYLREIKEFRAVQTDPHFGNYRVRIDPAGERDQLVLIDFGAVRELPAEFLENFLKVMRGGVLHEPDLIEAGGRALKILLPDDPQELVKKYVDLCFLITEPFALPEWGTTPSALLNPDGVYDWAGSDLPKRVAKAGSEIVFGYHLRAPPRETVFLDRKMGGAFVFLAKLRCQMASRELLLQTIS